MITSHADISTDKTRRWSLVRRWGKQRASINWIMLNPSTADGERDDPTIRKCIGFAERLGYDGIVVTNLFDLRTKDPNELKQHHQPCTQYNAHYVSVTARDSRLIVVAWGNHGSFRGQDSLYCQSILSPYRDKVFCLGRNVNGTPCHPLMLGYNTQMRKYFE